MFGKKLVLFGSNFVLNNRKVYKYKNTIYYSNKYWHGKTHTGDR